MKLACVGYGYVARHLAPSLRARGWQIAGTTRDEAKTNKMRAESVEPCTPETLPSDTTHLLLCAAPDAAGDPVIAHLPDLPALMWVGYLSATSVYGDHGGDWVDETTEPNPANARGEWRVAAEQQWLDYHPSTEIFRLSGIYGPGRNALDNVRDGTAKRIHKPGQYFSRIHVEDIAQLLLSALDAPEPQTVTNLADDMPSAPHEVTEYAAKLLKVTPPPLVEYADAQLSEMARGFYAANKRIANGRMKGRLASHLHYPDYKSGLAAIFAADSQHG